MRWIFALVIVAALAGLAYVRLAPSDPGRWHMALGATQDTDGDGSAMRVTETAPDVMARADAYMRALPRTEVLAGSVAEGHITYVTRSRLFGFPDYTTLHDVPSEGLFKAFARLRFGRSDMGVNRERLEGLFAALQ